MRKIITILLCLTLLISLNSTAVFANPGSGNVDGGGGSLGDGSSQYTWSPGDDGVRITVVDATSGQKVSASVDFASRAQPESIIHFGKNSKIDYRNGTSLYPGMGMPYVYQIPASPMPTIISASGGNNIAAIKQYFCSEYAAMMVAGATGIGLSDIISGKYKLLIEPIAYFTYAGLKYAFTATEVALYDNLVAGKMRANMGHLTHKNQPLAMFLESTDPVVGFQAWTGSRTSLASNANIIAYLGLGIVSYTDSPPQDPKPSTSDGRGSITAQNYDYRVNTDVITAVTLNAYVDVTPENPVTVSFNINGTIYTINNVVIPKNNSQIVWVKWRTPPTPGVVHIPVTASGGFNATATVTATIVDLNENIPPDPKATDTAPNGYSIPSPPGYPQRLSSSWGIWSAAWQPNWVWETNWVWEPYICDDTCPKDCTGIHSKWVDRGTYVDKGWWQYSYTSYYASLNASTNVAPDDKVPTANGNEMKSGYGIKQSVSSTVSSNAPLNHFTYSQTAVSYFPEFNYGTYWRLLDLIGQGYTSTLEFKSNPYSTYSRRVHFTPLWFPDSTRYTVSTNVIDTWTPAGMLSVGVTDYVDIQDNMFDDWYTNRE